MSETMVGRRLPDRDPNGDDTSFAPGDYGRLGSTWCCCTPNGHLGNLAAHHVTEHEDGTITVSPSILVSEVGPGPSDKRELWHGWLERGIWRSC